MQQNTFHYYTEDKAVLYKEYGRNIQNLLQILLGIKDKDQRTLQANTLIELMRRLYTGTISETVEDYQKLWNHLYIMADYNLDVDSPFPIPEKTKALEKPQRVSYTTSRARYKHYGYNLQIMIREASKIEDATSKDNATIVIGRLMKTFYMSWNKDTIDDKTIVKQLYELSQGALRIDEERVTAESLFDSPKEWRHGLQHNNIQSTPAKQHQRSNQRNNNNKFGKKGKKI